MSLWRNAAFSLRTLLLPLSANRIIYYPDSDGIISLNSTTTTAFTAAVTFTERTRSFTAQTVAAPIAFTIAAGTKYPGARSIYRLVADGVNTPTFTGFKQRASSSGYDNRAGTLNVIEFFYDGVDHWYEVWRERNVTPANYIYTTAGPFSLIVPPHYSQMFVRLISSTGGAGAGRKSATGVAAFGGGGSASANIIERIYTLADLGIIAGNTLSGSIGTGGTGGIATTANSTNGGNGSVGGDTLLRIGAAGTNYLAFAFSSNTGQGGTTTAGSAGSAGTAVTFAAAAGGASSTGATAGSGGSVAMSGGGGGAGGGIDAANVARAGGNGGRGMQAVSNTSTVPAGGAVGVAGGNGITPQNASQIVPGNGASGGGASTTGNGGNGGNAVLGSGAGGGGAARDSVGNAGSGGNGAPGAIQVIFMP